MNCFPVEVEVPFEVGRILHPTGEKQGDWDYNNLFKTVQNLVQQPMLCLFWAGWADGINDLRRLKKCAIYSKNEPLSDKDTACSRTMFFMPMHCDYLAVAWGGKCMLIGKGFSKEFGDFCLIFILACFLSMMILFTSSKIFPRNLSAPGLPCYLADHYKHCAKTRNFEHFYVRNCDSSP